MEYLLYCFLVSIIVIILILLHRNDRLKYEKNKQLDIEWEKQHSKIVADVVFHTTSGKFVNTGWDCYQTGVGDPYNIRVAAVARAKHYISRSFERGYFEDDNGITYPACNVIKAYVEVREK